MVAAMPWADIKACAITGKGEDRGINSVKEQAVRSVVSTAIPGDRIALGSESVADAL